MSNKGIKRWILAARPKTLPAALAPVLVGGALSGQQIITKWWIWLLILVAALLIQIITNYVNDLCDYLKGADGPAREGPLRVTQAKLVTVPEMKRAIFILIILALASGLPLVWIGGWPILLIGVTALIFAALYTAGPYPLAYSPLSDPLVFIYFGPVAVAGVVYLLTGTFSPEALIAGVAMGAISTAILVVNNMRDIDSDTQVGKRTLAVRIGRRAASNQYALLLLIALLMPPLLIIYKPQAVTLWAIFILVIPVWRLWQKLLRARNGSDFNQILEGTGRFLLLYAVWFSVLWGVY